MHSATIILVPKNDIQSLGQQLANKGYQNIGPQLQIKHNKKYISLHFIGCFENKHKMIIKSLSEVDRCLCYLKTSIAPIEIN